MWVICNKQSRTSGPCVTTMNTKPPKKSWPTIHLSRPSSSLGNKKQKLVRTYGTARTLQDKCNWHYHRHNKYRCCTLNHVTGLAQWLSILMLKREQWVKSQCVVYIVKIFRRMPRDHDWTRSRSGIHNLFQGCVSLKLII